MEFRTRLKVAFTNITRIMPADVLALLTATFRDKVGRGSEISRGEGGIIAPGSWVSVGGWCYWRCGFGRAVDLVRTLSLPSPALSLSHTHTCAHAVSLSRARPSQMSNLAALPVGDAELLLSLLWCLREGWPAATKDHVPVEMRELILQVHAR